MQPWSPRGPIGLGPTLATANRREAASAGHVVASGSFRAKLAVVLPFSRAHADFLDVLAVDVAAYGGTTGRGRG